MGGVKIIPRVSSTMPYYDGSYVAVMGFGSQQNTSVIVNII